MNLVIDCGNSCVKVAIYDRGQMVEIKRHNRLTADTLNDVCSRFDIERAIMSSVAVVDFDISNYFASRGVDFIDVDINTPMPITNGYETPESLGIDRLVVAIGAKSRFPNKELLVIDIGTAITIDRVSGDGRFLGGNISPGIDMRLKALNIFTSKIPLYEKSDFFSICGKNSKNATIGGVMYGIAKELDGYIDDYRRNLNEIVIIFTGGDAKYFDNKLKNTIFADCDTLLNGLNEILEYNF